MAPSAPSISVPTASRCDADPSISHNSSNSVLCSAVPLRYSCHAITIDTPIVEAKSCPTLKILVCSSLRKPLKLNKKVFQILRSKSWKYSYFPATALTNEVLPTPDSPSTTIFVEFISVNYQSSRVSSRLEGTTSSFCTRKFRCRRFERPGMYFLLLYILTKKIKITL